MIMLFTAAGAGGSGSDIVDSIFGAVFVLLWVVAIGGGMLYWSLSLPPDEKQEQDDANTTTH